MPDLVRVAAVVELVHLATLVHDDIMDEADVRRSRRTAAREFGPVAAVLLGDALFAHALHLATQFPTTEICAAVSESTRRVCAGEIVQTLRRGSLNISLADYQRIIDLKTAELFRVSCFLGAKLSGAESACAEAAALFGRHLGIAYQIYDDLADYFGTEARIGKTLGTDLASGKLTLPLITLSERLPAAERQLLAEEIIGKRPPQLALRLQQMNALGVFAAVTASIHAELANATAALAPWPAYPATSHLLALGDVLRAQVAALQINA
jgi:octaprenyl-diphosphate synthase